MKRKDVCPADCPGRHSGCHAECARYLECRREALERYKKKRMDTIIAEVQYSTCEKSRKRGG